MKEIFAFDHSQDSLSTALGVDPEKIQAWLMKYKKETTTFSGLFELILNTEDLTLPEKSWAFWFIGRMSELIVQDLIKKEKL